MEHPWFQRDSCKQLSFKHHKLIGSSSRWPHTVESGVWSILQLLLCPQKKLFVSFSEEVFLTYLVIPWLRKLAWLSSSPPQTISCLVCLCLERSLSHFCLLTIFFLSFFGPSTKPMKKDWKLPNSICIWGTQGFGGSHPTFSDSWEIWSYFPHQW